VAQGVVDLLESIQIDQQQCHLLALFRPTVLQGLPEPLVEPTSVGQIGQQVVVGLVPDLSFGTLALGDIHHDAVVHHALRIPLHLVALDTHPAGRSIGHQHAKLETARQPTRRGVVEHRQDLLPILRQDAPGQLAGVGLKLLRIHPEQADRTRTDIQKGRMALRVQSQAIDHAGHLGRDLPQQFLAFAQRQGRPLPGPQRGLQSSQQEAHRQDHQQPEQQHIGRKVEPAQQ
jgi:hypothetical protein